MPEPVVVLGPTALLGRAELLAGLDAAVVPGAIDGELLGVVLPLGCSDGRLVRLVDPPEFAIARGGVRLPRARDFALGPLHGGLKRGGQLGFGG